MATQEKLLKSIETLRKLSSPENASNSGNSNVKKEKIYLCNIITDSMTNSSIQIAPNFPMLLNYSMEILLEFCDDPDSDIRMIIEECLNRLIRGTRDENMTKILIELINEIKRNKSVKSLRTALVKFSKLVNYVRPHKGKLYVSSLFPSLMKITERNEEAVHETLSNSLSRIIEILGPFTTDNDIKNLLKSFWANISNPSVVIKRTTAVSIQNVCLNCQKPYSTVVYCIHIVLGFVFPLNENCDNHLIFGVMGVLKILIPYWKKFLVDERKNEKVKFGGVWGELKVEQLLQIYELCLHYLDHNDHNIVIYSLETLNILLQNSTKELEMALLNPSGLSRTKIHKSNQSSPSIEFKSKIDKMSNSDLRTPMLDKSITKNVYMTDGSDFLTKSVSQIDISSEVDETYHTPSEILLKSSSLYDDVLEKNYKDFDIGNFDDENIPLIYCARLIAKTFLLSGIPNELIADKKCRISVKSSALMCFSSILNLYPNLLEIYLPKNDSGNQLEDQKMYDILKYSDHSDPQLRGNMRILIGNYINSILMLEQRGKYVGNEERMKEFIDIIKRGLVDHFSCTRQTIHGLKLCLNIILESEYCWEIIPLLSELPLLAKNPYWLIKVSLCELVSSISYVTIYFTTGTDKFQKDVLNMIIFELIKDSDARVRNAASNALTRLISELYFGDNAVTSKSVLYRDILLTNLYNESWKNGNESKKNLEKLMFPFNRIHDPVSKNIEINLSKIVTKIEEILIFSNGCKHTVLGCIEVLALLSTNYPCTTYKNSWNCNISIEKQKETPNDLLNFCIDLIYNSELSYDIGLHTNLLKLISNLYVGYSISILKPQIEPTLIDDYLTTKKWVMFDSTSHSNLSEMLLKHIVKLLSISKNVIDDSYQKHVKPVLLSLPTASPMKRRKSDLDRKLVSPTKNIEEKNERKDKEKNVMGSYAHLPHYVKIYESLKTSYSNYKTSLELEASETFLKMLEETLKSLSILMEIGSVAEFGCLAEEILNCLSSIFRILPSETVECVQQLLKSIFDVNLTARQEDLNNFSDEENETNDSSFYQEIFMKPYNEISRCVSNLKELNESDSEGDQNRFYGRKKKYSIKLDKNLENYIRIFEPMVIKSLKQYTITSDVILQGRVLQLLSQLIQLKINYCLLDSEQIFINFVLSQFEFIEEGQIRNAEELVPKIFQFLVQLSYSKQHTKSIITVPKIIQLCDGLIASGQSTSTHSIPALKPIIEDIFLSRNALSAVDLRELETTREVLLSMLLRLIDNYEIVDLTVVILNSIKYCDNSSYSDKWARWSHDVFNALTSMLKFDRYNLDNVESLISLKKLVFVLNPCVFRNIDNLIVMLFQEPPNLVQDVVQFTRWLGRILIILTILSTLEEDVILSKITILKGKFNANSVFENIVITQDPLNVSNSADYLKQLSPEIILIRFIFRTLTLVTKKCDLISNETRNEKYDFFVEQLAMFMMFCLHSFQSGFLCKTANTAILFIEKRKYAEECDALNMEPLNENFLNLIHTYPILTFQWCQFLTLINYEDQYFWSAVLQISNGEHKGVKNSKSINKKIVEVGGCIVFCDFLCENLNIETDDILWILGNKVTLLIELFSEVQISEFISFVHRNAKLSQEFLNIIEKKCLKNENLIFQSKLLKCIENAHLNVTWNLIKLLMGKLIKNMKNSVLLKEILKLSTRKLEMLLTMPSDKIQLQLNEEDISSILTELNIENKCKYEVLQGLLRKLKSRISGSNVKEVTPDEIVDSNFIKNLEIDKEWYFEQVKLRIFNKSDAKICKELAEILSVLNYEEQMEIMRHKKFDKAILRNCMEFGFDDFVKKDRLIVPDILRASVDCLYSQITEILEISRPEEIDVSTIPFNFHQFSSFHILNTLSFYLNSVHSIMKNENSEDIIEFTLLSLKYLHSHFKETNKFNISFLNESLLCFDSLMQQNDLFAVLNSIKFSNLICTSISVLFELIEILSGAQIFCDKSEEIIRNFDNQMEGEACSQLHSLIAVFFGKFKLDIPHFLLKIFENILISLGKFSMFNCYMLIPVKVWSNLRNLSSSTSSLSHIPPSLPVELLQDIDILEEYIFRVNLLGWTNRQRFEETWMNLLSVLCNTPSDESNNDEINEIHTSISMVIRGISSMLVQSMYYPTPGWRNVSELLHVSRDFSIKCDRPEVKKSKEVQNFIKTEFNKSIFSVGLDSVFDEINLEKIDREYSIGQLSIEYFLIALGVVDELDEENSAYRVWKKRKEILEKHNLDVNSCIQFLQDYSTQVLENQKITSLKLFHELIYSILILSDFFNDKSQFGWMFDLFNDLLKNYANEDELIHQYLLIGICKSVAILNPELEVYENVKKYLVQFLKYSFLPSQKASLNGLLYLIEGCKLNNISIGNISEELQLILPCAIEYLQLNLPTENNRNRPPNHTEEHKILMWTLAFFIIENIDEEHIESTFIDNVFNASMLVLFGNGDYFNEYKCVMKGLQRLIITKKKVLDKIRKKLVKFLLDGLKNDNPSKSACIIQFLFVYMYSDCFKSSDVQKNNPEHLVQTIEKFSALFEHIKKGYVSEVEILCPLLTRVINDFFTPADILTKVICEFLSAQKSHQKSLSKVIFHIFQSAIRQNQLTLLQDWIVFSLPNFTQNFAYPMATWCLTCFFISASRNKWLISLFPYVQTRIHRYEHEDRKMLSITGSDFYRNLSNEKLKETFRKTVQSTPETPFKDLLSSL